MTAPTHSLSPSPSTSPKGVDQLARVAGKPLPKSDEKRSSRAFKSFLGKTGLIDLLRARQGLVDCRAFQQIVGMPGKKRLASHP